MMVHLKDKVVYRKIWIDSNKIMEPRKEMFEGLDSIELLNMDGNFISVLKGGVFTSLRTLKELDFENNTLTEVRSDAFRGLNLLSTVWLNENNLTTLESSIFFPLPRPLTLSLNDNPMICDNRLCWLKRGEREGWVRCVVSVVADLGGAPGPSQFFRFDIQSLQNVTACGVDTPYEAGAPFGNSWIHHCSGLGTV